MRQILLFILGFVLSLGVVGCDTLSDLDGNETDDPEPEAALVVTTPVQFPTKSMYYPGESVTLEYGFSITASNTSALEIWVKTRQACVVRRACLAPSR